MLIFFIIPQEDQKMKKKALISILIIGVFVMAGITTLAIAGVEPSPFRPGIHTVISEKLLYVVDGETGVWYDSVRGAATLSWNDGTRDGFFSAKVIVLKEEDVGLKIEETKEAVTLPVLYTFDLVAISSCDSQGIKGLWDVRRNGKLVCEGCVGEAYGLDGRLEEDYFKLYIGDSQCYAEKWHLSGYITQRIDIPR
jgi:inhibitor of cysteine peptidase